MKKIAYLFLIYDEINHEELWHKYFKNIDKSRYSIYIHYKYNKPLQYFDSFKLDVIIQTEYAELSLVKAQNSLLREALKNHDNERFVFLSNSCIPLKKFDYIYDNLFESTQCHFNMARDEHILERGRGKNLLKKFDNRNVKKASQWCVLTKNIADILAKSDAVLESLYEPGGKDLADEYFYISYLHYLNKEGDIQESHYEAVNCITFEYWNDKNYKFREAFTSTHPEQWDRRLKTYYDISQKELLFLLQAPCLFGRKFDINCTVDGKVPLLNKLAEIYNR